VVPGDPGEIIMNYIAIGNPDISLDVRSGTNLGPSLAGAKVKNTTPIAFSFFNRFDVGFYLPNATVRVELTTPDGRIITVVPDADGTIQDLTNIALRTYEFYEFNPWHVNISRLEPGTYTARAVWERPQDCVDYAEDSNTVSFEVVLNGVSIESDRKSLMKKNPFITTIYGKPSSDYYLYVRNAAIAADRYPFIVPGQSSAEILNASPFPDSVDPDAKALAEGDRAVAGGAYVPGTAAVVTTDADGVCSVEFGTNSATVPTNYYIVVVDPADVALADRVRISVGGGEVTITAEGAGIYYLGETVKFSGTNSDSNDVYLFITNPNLGDGAGVALDNLSACASDGNYVRCPVTNNNWAYNWDTAALGRSGQILDPGTYTIYACGNNIDSQDINIDKEHLSGVQYQAFSVQLKAPYLSLADIDAIVAKSDKMLITGTAEGEPDEVRVWIFGENDCLFGVNVTVPSDGLFTYTLDGGETQELSSGRYYVVVQHPAVDRTFNVYPFMPDNATDFRIANTWSSDIVDLGGLVPSDAAATLVEMINAPESDDISREAAFDIEEPWIEIDPVANHAVGETVTVSGSTNLAVGDRLFFDVVRASFDPTDPGDEPGYGASGNTTVRAGTEHHEWSFEVDTAKFNAEAYRVAVESVDADTMEITTFSLDEPPMVHAAFSASPTLGVAPLAVRFSDLSTNASAWAWTFGDGNTSADQNPTHIYTEDGNYTVVLSVNGGAGVANATITVLPVLFGDANENGVIDQADTLRVLKQVVGMAAKPASGTERFRKTDVHKNGEIDIGDALFIAQYNVGLRGPWFGMVG